MLGIKKLVDGVRIDNDPTSVDATFDFNGIEPRRITFLVEITKTLSPTSLTLSVDVSPDRGATLIDYDKLLTDAGADGPVSSVAYTATADDVVSLSPEDAVPYIKLTLAGSGTDATNYFTANVWLVYAY